MKFKSEIVTQVSGSIGGTTYSHNRGGMYRRARSIPTNPDTSLQQASRNAFGMLAAYWRDTLSTAQRDAWSNYAEQSPIVDKLGDPLVLTGQQMFIRSNQPRARAGEALVAAGPTTSGVGVLTPASTYNLDNFGGSNFLLPFDNTDAWAGESGGFLMAQISDQFGASINFFKGPYKLLGAVAGAGTPPTSGTSFANPWGTAFDETRFVFLRLCASGADGRLTNVLNIKVNLDEEP